MKQDSLNLYLQSTEIIDWKSSGVRKLAQQLSQNKSTPLEITKNCFEWVRDEIKHSHDYRMNPITCTASEVLEAGTGYCFAKSHLLAALLRANSIPAGLCYQRLSRDENGPPYSLHGLNAVHLPSVGWYRIDPRGNRSDVDAQFTPPIEKLAFPIRLLGEADLPEIWSEPLSAVVQALRRHTTYDTLWQDLPDVELIFTSPLEIA